MPLFTASGFVGFFWVREHSLFFFFSFFFFLLRTGHQWLNARKTTLINTSNTCKPSLKTVICQLPARHPYLVCFSIFFFLSENSAHNFFPCFAVFLWPFLPLPYRAVIYCPIVFSHSFMARHSGAAFKHDFANIFSLGSIHYCNYHSIFLLPLLQCPLSSLPVLFSLNFFFSHAFTRKIREGGLLLLFFKRKSVFMEHLEFLFDI